MSNIKMNENIKRALQDLPDILSYTCKTYTELNNSIISPQMLGAILQNVYKQGVILKDNNYGDTPSKFYLHINDELIDLNYSSEDGIINWKLYTSKLVKNLNDLHVVNYDLLDVLHTYSQVKDFCNTQENFIEYFKQFHKADVEYLRDVNKAYTLNMPDNQIHDTEYLKNKKIGNFNECKNNPILLENLVKLNGGKLIDVYDERNGVSNTFYEKNGIYFNPNEGGGWNSSSSSIQDIYIKHLFDINQHTLNTKQILASVKHLKITEKPLDIKVVPFEIVEKTDKDKSVAELLKEFETLNKRMSEISESLKQKTQER